MENKKEQTVLHPLADGMSDRHLRDMLWGGKVGRIELDRFTIIPMPMLSKLQVWYIPESGKGFRDMVLVDIPLESDGNGGVILGYGVFRRKLSNGFRLLESHSGVKGKE